MAEEEDDILESTKLSLKRVSEFEAKTLPRTDDLGRGLNFDGAVDPANRVIGLFRKLPTEALVELPEEHLKVVKEQADQFYQLLGTALKFSPGAQANPATERDSIVQQIEEQYPSAFKSLFPYISYAVARTVDFNRLEEQGRAAIQNIEDRTEGVVTQFQEYREQIQKTLEDVRAAAAEQGVSQQAHYFKAEADTHETHSSEWLKWTLVSAGGLIVYAIASLFFHLIPGLTPTTTYEAFQLGASKVLIFIVAGYVVLTCGRKFLSQKHNAIVNRHRQNGLQTFTTLVDAAGTSQAQDIVLSHAAASIFEPQETGYAKQQHSQDGALSAATVLRSLSSQTG